MARGRLRIYLGAAPGVGKTYAMLNEGWRRHQRGQDIVVAYLETHGRKNTEAQLRDLEVIPRRRVLYRGQEFEEMDLAAVLERRPAVALVDELAHTNVPGSEHPKRWQDIHALLDAGIDVISTVNIQHLESLSDVVAGITGVVQRERVPDNVVRSADQIELVDMSPESLRRRLAHGNVYAPDKVNAALANYFRQGNLSALRELALLWVADRVDEGLQEYRERHGIAEPWETKERVVVALTGAEQGERLIRRGARMAARTRAELVGVHIRPADGLADSDRSLLDAHRSLLLELGGRYCEAAGHDVATALVDFARAENATQLLLGATNRNRWTEFVRGSIINQVLRRAGGIDVHVISTRDGASRQRLLPSIPHRRRLATLPARRVAAGWVMAVVGLPLLAILLTSLRSGLGPTLGLPEQLLAVVLVAIVGGVFPALAGSLIAFALTDWYLIPPIHSWTIGRSGDIVALVTFVVTAMAVSGLIDTLARRTLETGRARAESEALARMAGDAVLAGAKALPRLVEDLRATFGLEAVAVLAPSETDLSEWTVEAAAGAPTPKNPDEGLLTAELAGGRVLVIAGSALAADDRRLLGVFVAQLRLAQRQEELTQSAAIASSLAEANELRTALLAAVSHDLRSPLASIKASVSSLLSDEVDWPSETIRSFYETIDVESDRLNNLVGNLLDMSRLQTGALKLSLRPVGLEEVVFAALASISGDASAVRIDVAETLPPILTDPALLERAIANLVANALRWNDPSTPVTIRAEVDPAWPTTNGRIILRISDRGPGIPVSQRQSVFQPFQRLGDSQAGDAKGDGVGLGLAVARGFIEATDAELILDDTPGGGLTAVVILPTSSSTAPATLAAPDEPANRTDASQRAGTPDGVGPNSQVDAPA